MHLVFTILLATVTGVFSQGCLSDVDDTNYPKTIQTDLYKGQRSFSISLLKAIRETSPADNIFCSPYSTYQALLLAYFGADDITEQELKRILNLDWVKNKNHVWEAYNLEKTQRISRQQNSSIIFTSANKIFFSRNAKLRECMSNIFKDELEPKDFRVNPEQCRKEINAWVADMTHQEIEEILFEGDITAQTNLVLANAAYFKGEWDIKFDPEATEKKVFHISTEKQTLIDMMYTKGTFRTGYDERLKAHILELPYAAKGDDKEPEISMIILLPPFIQGVDEILANLTAEDIETILKTASSREIEVSLPKFEFKRDVSLTPIFKKMGLRTLFSSKSNLSRFSKETALSLDEARHIAKIKVDEEGSTAAAATVMFSFRSARPLDPAKFECNRPFLFIIYDHKSNSFLFTGIYRDPAQK